MIPTPDQAKALWDKYQLPQIKRRHVRLVADVALYLAQAIIKKDPKIQVATGLLEAAALLHDIDKNIPRLPGESHPETGVRILREEGMDEVAELVSTHSLPTILEPIPKLKRWEEKLLFLADKMVKNDVIGVDKRFDLWNGEHLPPGEQEILDRSYPKVKDLEKEILQKAEVTTDDVASYLTP